MSSGLLGCARSRLSENAVLGAEGRPRWGGGARRADPVLKTTYEMYCESLWGRHECLNGHTLISVQTFRVEWMPERAYWLTARTF